MFPWCDSCVSVLAQVWHANLPPLLVQFNFFLKLCIVSYCGCLFLQLGIKLIVSSLLKCCCQLSHAKLEVVDGIVITSMNKSNVWSLF